MSNYNWCHGPSCHTNHTVDRVRGSKGNKVLRTRKIVENNWNRDYWTKYFCSQGCMLHYIQTHIDRVIAIAPRLEALETPIEDPQKKTHNHGYGNYNEWTIEKKVVDNA
tara:strand:+ start:218 stop:544 length:327 start_codon:yes stop_codon:yes gene_type:complete